MQKFQNQGKFLNRITQNLWKYGFDNFFRLISTLFYEKLVQTLHYTCHRLVRNNVMIRIPVNSSLVLQTNLLKLLCFLGSYVKKEETPAPYPLSTFYINNAHCSLQQDRICKH